MRWQLDSAHIGFFSVVISIFALFESSSACRFSGVAAPQHNKLSRLQRSMAQVRARIQGVHHSNTILQARNVTSIKSCKHMNSMPTKTHYQSKALTKMNTQMAEKFIIPKQNSQLEQQSNGRKLHHQNTLPKETTA